MNNGILDTNNKTHTINSIYSLLGNPSRISTVLDRSGPKLLLDICPGVTTAYSLRRLSSNYNGPLVRVRRGGGVEEKDFTSDDIDSGYLAKWIGTGNATFPSVNWSIDTYRGGSIFGVNTYPTQVVGQNDPFNGTGAAAVSWTTGGDIRYGLASSGAGSIPAVSLPVTFSFWARVDSGTANIASVLRSDPVPDVNLITHTITTSWTRFSNTHTRNVANGTNGWYFTNAPSNTTIYFYGFQFEIGSTPTDLVITTNESTGIGYVSIWYDQSGNGYHLYAPSLSTQPCIGIGNNLLVRNGKPYVDFFQSRWLNTHSSLSLTNSTIATVGSRNFSGSGRGYFSIADNDLAGLENNTLGFGWFNSGTSVYDPAASTRFLLTGILDNTSTSLYSSRALVAHSNSPTRYNRASRIVLNNGRFNNRPVDAKIEEVIYYANGLNNIKDIETNMGLYYNFILSPEYVQPPYDDSDVVSYIRSVEAADQQALEDRVRDAYNNFILGCKNDGIWSAIKNACILAGARTLNGALTPLVGSRPTNFAFSSGDYNRKTGLIGNGLSKYLDTNRNNNTDPQNNHHMAVYATSVQNELDKAFIGAGAASTGSTQITASANGGGGTNGINVRNRTANLTIISNAVGSGIVGASRSSSSSYVARANGTNTTINTTSEVPFNGNVLVFARNSATNTVGLYASHRLAWYSIGEALDLSLLESRLATLLSTLDSIL